MAVLRRMNNRIIVVNRTAQHLQLANAQQAIELVDEQLTAEEPEAWVEHAGYLFGIVKVVEGYRVVVEEL